MPKRHGGSDMSNGFPIMTEITNLNDLGNQQEYQAFNYDKYINAIKTSNFAGGCGKKNCKKMNTMLKEMYVRYVSGKPSNIKSKSKKRGGSTLDDQFNVPLTDMRNVGDLAYDKPWQYADVKRLSTIPISNFET